ncbi:hypothetical protein [Neptunitalea lumnitzerae]|uniref:Tic20 family protein Ycf60 n=1 Tax=Neptunitalea lumnitzerae TaxID=2965509 RepID=A0ABQ5MEZ9_9FLAO|nr:hypothetical protein [Neptunitalea sp. Y10]GLB47891.1 hypothetical protein Y10_02590 [Neptunitalea sp. Y10]
MKTPLLKILIGLLLLSFVGIKYHPEFNEPDFFIKHKPSLKMEYRSPLAETDSDISLLSKQDQAEELAYREFVGTYMNYDLFDDIAPLIIALIMYCFSTGILQIAIKRRRRKPNNLKRKITSYLGNLMLFFVLYAFYWNVYSNGVVLIVTYAVASLSFQYVLFKWNRKKKKKKPTHNDYGLRKNYN